MEYKYVEELFSLPVGLELEAIVDGQKFYSSESLKRAFLKSLGSTGRSAPIYKQLESLVLDKKILVPCYLSKNLFNLVRHKIFGDVEDKSILGFYHMIDKRVFILIDNNIGRIGTAKNDELASTTMHECSHLYADRMRNKFLNLFKQELQRFYISYFSRVFEIKTKPNVDKIIKFLFQFEYTRSKNTNKQLSYYYNLLHSDLKNISTLDEEEFTKRVTAFIVCCKLMFVNFNSFLAIARKNSYLFEALDRAYLEAFGRRNTISQPYQELVGVTEVISILTEMKPTYPKIKKMFKDMA